MPWHGTSGNWETPEETQIQPCSQNAGAEVGTDSNAPKYTRLSLTAPPSPAASKLPFPEVPVIKWLGWNRAQGDSCPHEQTASLNLIKMSSLSA